MKRLKIGIDVTKVFNSSLCYYNLSELITALARDLAIKRLEDHNKERQRGGGFVAI